MNFSVFNPEDLEEKNMRKHTIEKDYPQDTIVKHVGSKVKDTDYDYINPQHYVSDDGRQTWERMVDIWGAEATALWCEMTAFKYTDTRIGKKPGEDVEREKKKVEWYLKKAHELRQSLKNE